MAGRRGTRSSQNALVPFSGHSGSLVSTSTHPPRSSMNQQMRPYNSMGRAVAGTVSNPVGFFQQTYLPMAPSRAPPGRDIGTLSAYPSGNERIFPYPAPGRVAARTCQPRQLANPFENNNNNMSLPAAGGQDPLSTMLGAMQQMMSRMELNPSNSSGAVIANLSGPGGGTAIMHSTVSTVSYGNGAQPRVQYEASETTRRGPGGVSETHKFIRDANRGEERSAHIRAIGQRQHAIDRTHSLRTGEMLENEEFVNMHEHEALPFHDEWNQRAAIGGGPAMPALLPGPSSSSRIIASSRAPTVRKSRHSAAAPAGCCGGSSSGAGCGGCGSGNAASSSAHSHETGAATRASATRVSNIKPRTSATNHAHHNNGAHVRFSKATNEAGGSKKG